MALFDNIAKSLYTAAQLPLDAKAYFPTLTQMRDLGVGNNKAYMYYEWMTVTCVEAQGRFVWKEVDVNYVGGVLENNFLYPSGTLSDGIDYSNRYFNFVAETSVQGSGTIAKKYVIFKYPGNTGDYLEVNDVAEGFFSSTEFKKMRYKGGPVSERASWATIEKINPITYIDE